MIVFDGMNVALRKNQKQFSSEGLKQAVDFFLQRGHQVQIFLPDYILKIPKGQKDLKKIPDDMKIIEDLNEKNFICGVPSWQYDDSYIIDYAQKKNGYILTNDRYKDYIEKYSKNDMVLELQFKNWLRSHCISFTFTIDDFLPSQDFISEKKL